MFPQPHLTPIRRWKTAIVTPLHKSGDQSAVTQYRPISNLDSLSKLFEKIILNKLDEIGELDGKHQHGFKKHRSTTTAMIEIQDYVASQLDRGKIVATYSLDLSAAFDLLRPDVFYDSSKDVLPADLINPIMDFLSFRTFQVQVGKSRSNKRELKVGCVQGSILGPRLFTLYMRNLRNILGCDVHVTAYADDTYVSISRDTVDDLKIDMETIMTTHDNYLLNIGMKTNVMKTEFIYFSRTNLPETPSLLVKGIEVKPTTKMKILGIKFQHDLGWDAHIDSLRNKSRVVFAKLKYLRRLIDLEGMRRILTTHFYGMLYYASQVWLNELTLSKHWKSLNSLHYKALRSSVGDFRNKIARATLNQMFKRATPVQWMCYSNAKLAITLYNTQNGPEMSAKLRNASYINDRTSGRAIFMDSSRLRIGKNSLCNRLNCMRSIKFDWTNGITDHALRTNLKKTFYPNFT